MATAKNTAIKPRFALTLREKKSHHMMEKQPRYDILVNDKVQGELYYNMRGYVGYLPTVHGSVMNIGERAISAFRKEAMILNREAIQAIDAAKADPRRITQTWPTEDNTILLAKSETVVGNTVDFHHIPRRTFLTAQALFGEDVGLAFFGRDAVKPAPDGAVALIPESEAFAGDACANIATRRIDAAEADLHQRAIEWTFDTVDPQVKLVIGHRVFGDADPEPYFVDRLDLEMSRARLKDALRIGDLKAGAPAPIANEDDCLFMQAEFPRFDPTTGASREPEPETATGPEF